MHAHAFSRACVGGARPGVVSRHRGEAPRFPMPTTPAAAASSPLSVARPPRRNSGGMAVDLREAHRRIPRRARLLAPRSSLAGDAGALADSGGGNSGGGGGGGKGLGGDGKGGDGSGEGDENAPISAAAIAATVCLLFFFQKKQLAPFDPPFCIPARRAHRVL